MPFVSNMSNDEEGKKDPSLPQGPVAPTGGGGGSVRLAPSAGVSPGGGVGAGSVSPRPLASPVGGSFASLDKYLNANQGQAEPLAGKLTSGIGQQYNTLQGQNASTLSDINSQVAANAVPQNYQDTLAQEAANPVSFANDQGNVKQFQGLLNASYGGPASAESTNQYQTQQAAINNAIATGKNATTTEAGRENLLKQNEAAPTTGVTALNSAILSKSPTALGSVTKAYDPFSNLLSGLSTGAATANQQIAQNQANATGANTSANQQLTKQEQDLQNAVTQQYQGAQKQVNSYNEGLPALQTQAQSQNEALLQAAQAAPGKYTGNLQNLAGNPANAQPLLANLAKLLDVSKYTSQLQPYFNAQPIVNAPTQASTATQNQFAEDQALQQLAGGAYSPILGGARPDQIGTYQSPATMAAVPDFSGVPKYINDIGTLYGNAGLSNVNIPGGWQNASPSDLAAAALKVGPGQGFTADQASRDAFQRLIDNIYTGR